ncbi:tRNA-dependent cyclodipeptide synthase [Streptomyces sp. NEAU-174]|uniref:tRNA-dependent cyclodipeptide synthase n=1 Tax=Streptomyces sp. NEAU-174 TaxID=3458254 RepID=UPI0040439E6A
MEPARRTRYKAEIALVSPITIRTTFEQHDTCFLGVSLENSNFATAKLTSMVKWISRRFARCTVLIGDSIHRLTLESTRGMAPEEAFGHALELGCQFVENERKVFDEYGDSTDFTFLNCSDVQNRREFAEFRAELRTFFAKDEVLLTASTLTESARPSGKTASGCRTGHGPPAAARSRPAPTT